MELKYPFIAFSEDKQDNCCCYVLPVKYGDDIAFYAPLANKSIYIVNQAGVKIGESLTTNSEDGYVDFSGIDLSSLLAPGDCFRLFLDGMYSNMFKFICNEEDTHHFEYWEEGKKHQKVRLSCIIENSQSKTDNSEYTDSNGFVHSLSKTRRKKHEMTTNFYPEYVHDAIKEMLLHPHLLVDDVPVYESDEYNISWNDKDENGDMKATVVLNEQGISRYSICEYQNKI
jgi:hypothetical protein